MSWFDILKLEYSTTPQEEETERQRQAKFSEQDKFDFGTEQRPTMEGKVGEFKRIERRTPQGTIPIDPKKQKVKTLHSYGKKHFREPLTSQRDTSPQTGDDTKLNVQEATRRLQRQPRGHYTELADEVTRLALDSRVNSEDQKIILGKIRSRLEQENIPRA